MVFNPPGQSHRRQLVSDSDSPRVGRACRLAATLIASLAKQQWHAPDRYRDATEDAMSATSHDEGQPPPKVTKSAGAARLSAFAAVAAVIVTAVIGWRTLNHSSTQDQQSAEQVRQQLLAQQSRDAKAATDALDAQYASAVTALGVADPTGRVNAVRTLVAFAKAHPVPYGEDAVQRLAVTVALWSPAVPRHAFVNAVPPEALLAAGQLRNLLQSLYPQPDGHTPKLTLANADLHGQSWGSMRMANAYAAHMDLRAANLTNDRMTGATLDDSSMTCANLAGARMQGASPGSWS